jgi:hypothetical protein
MRAHVRAWGVSALIAAVTGLGLVAPSAALADPPVTTRTSTTTPPVAAPGCRPTHEGQDWQWHPRGGDGAGHWDHWQRGRNEPGEWKHLEGEDRFCKE